MKLKRTFCELNAVILHPWKLSRRISLSFKWAKRTRLKAVHPSGRQRSVLTSALWSRMDVIGCGRSGVTGSTHTLAQLTDEEGSQRGLLVVVLNVHVDDVHRLKGLLLARVQVWKRRRGYSAAQDADATLYVSRRVLTLQHLVVHALLAGDDQVELVFAALEALGSGLDALVAV